MDLGSHTSSRRKNEPSNGNSSGEFRLPIPTESHPQYLLDEKDATGYWLHLRIHWVGVWIKYGCLFYRIPCKLA